MFCIVACGFPDKHEYMLSSIKKYVSFCFLRCVAFLVLILPSGMDVEEKYFFGVKDDTSVWVTTHGDWVIAPSSEIQ